MPHGEGAGEGLDASVPGYPLVQRVEVVTEGGPSILVWLVGGEADVARLPVTDY